MHSARYMSDPPASLYQKVLSCDRFDDVANDVLAPVLESLEAESAVFIQMFSSPTGDCHFGTHSYVGHKPDCVGLYMDEFHSLDPVMRPAIDWLQKPDRPLPPLFAAAPDEGVSGHSHYADGFLRPFDIGPVLALVMPMTTNFETQLACVGFHRRFGEPAFSAEQIAWFQQIGPAVRSSLQLLACREAIDFSEAIALAARDSGAQAGFLILDEDLVVRNCNAAAMEVIGLHAAQPHGSQLLGEIKQRLLACDAGDGAGLRFTVDEPRQMEIEIRNLRSAEGKTFHLIVMNRSEKLHAIDQACRQFGLTGREAEVVSLIAAGKCNASLSHELGISLRTSENHLRAIYRKVGVSSRTQLISRMLQIH